MAGASLSSEREGRAYLFMLAGALAFASMGALSHLAGEHCDWRLVAVARTLLAFLLSSAIALSAGVRLVLWRPRALWVRSLSGSLGVLCAFYALTHLPVSTALTLSNTVPLWVALLAWPVLGERPGAGVWAAIAAGLCGIALIQKPRGDGETLAALLAVGNALATSVAMLGLNRLGGLDARAVVVHFSGVSTVFTVAFLLLSSGAVEYSALADPRTLLLLAGVGLTGTLGQLAMTRAFALGSAPRVSVVGLTQIVFAALFDLTIWRRPFDALTVLGILLVVAPSVWLTLHHPLRKQTPIHTTT
ncbi:MAG TPA: DMT family transporter [Pyrinomonadaceae bacterium]|nr:DMT family transporter [Pyrinomonadaceae bacterium]